MILASMVYGLVVGALAAFAAWFIERAQGAFGRPRKHAWLGGIAAALLVPLLVMSLREPGRGAPVWAQSVNIPVRGAAEARALHVPAASPGGEANRGSLDVWLAALWAMTSTVLVAIYVFSAWRLGRRSRGWGLAQIDSSPVSVAPDIGPAVFGWARSRVVFPRWLIEAPANVQRLALAHEREHLDSRDPQVLSAATLLAALLPWNLPLLWMLRRLRFAMEVDCDARVIRRGADPHAYGLALLYVSERQSRAPVTAIALIGRKSQLEQRINFMIGSQRKHTALIAGLCLAMAGACLYAATALQAPTLATSPRVHKPPPDQNTEGFKLGQRFERHLAEHYPELIGGKFSGQPIVVALLNEDLSVARSVQMPAEAPAGTEVKVTSEMFGVLGISPGDVPYSGAMGMQMAPGKVVIMAYTEKGKPGERFTSKAFPDTRRLDRELFKQEFPDSQAGVTADRQHWLLLDRNGAVVRKGIEPASLTDDLAGVLRKRFAGIQTREVTVTRVTDASGEPLVDAAGKDLHLWCVWLAPDSPLPQS